MRAVRSIAVIAAALAVWESSAGRVRLPAGAPRATELKQTIVFVTHGIEESLLLADRVVVMTYRPGTVKKIVPVTLGRPRDEATSEFSTALRAVTELVREEQRRHERDEQT